MTWTITPASRTPRANSEQGERFMNRLTTRYPAPARAGAPRANSEQGERFMNRLTTRYRAAGVAVVVGAIAAIVGLAPHLGFTGTTTPLWSDRPGAVR